MSLLSWLVRTSLGDRTSAVLARLSFVAVQVCVACASPPAMPPEAAPAAKASTGAMSVPTAAPAPSRSRAAWLADLDALEQHMGQRYANLEWNAEVRRLDLAALDRSTRAALVAAQTDLEATEALARFVGAFRDAHLTWSSPLPSTDYDLRLTSDGNKVAVRLAGPGPCGLVPGEEIDTLEGKPALEQLARRLPLGSFGNDALRRDTALRTFTSSPFAPREQLRLTVRRGGRSVRCTLFPRTSAPTSGPTQPTPATAGETACAAFGIAPGDPRTRPFLFRPERHADFRPHASGRSDLASGILRLGSARTLGWLRIPLFSADAYPAACARGWMQFRAGLDRPCDDTCRDEFLGRFLPRLLVDDIAARLEWFRRARVSGTIIDITDNGGGDDWTNDVLRMLTARPLVCPATAAVRDPAAVERLDRELEGQRACEGMALGVRARSLLKAEQTWTQHVRADAAKPCDLGGLFRGKPPAASCSLLTRKRRAPCDDWPAPAGVEKIPDGCAVFRRPGAFAKGRGLARGPVYVLINRRTGSAAEFLAAVLRDNGAATLIGEPTAGAGCGYVDGGSPITLAQSGMTVAVPNCARFRADGTNEVDGVKPDVFVSWTVDDLTRFDSYAEKILASAGALFTPQRRPLEQPRTR